MSEAAPDPKDLCKCGDYRDQHDDLGNCLLNNLGHHDGQKCRQFRFLREAALTLHVRSEEQP